MAAERNPFAKYLTHFEKGHVVFREGDEGDEMYVIQSGKVAIRKRLREGETTLAVLEKGDFFGEMAILERMPRSASAEVVESGDLIVISGEVFGDMIKANPEIAVRMLRKQSIRLRETNKQLEEAIRSSPAETIKPEAARKVAKPPATPPGEQTLQAEAKAYLISASTGNVFPVFTGDSLIGRFDSVTGMRPDIDLTNEDQSRNVSRRHARLVIRDGQYFMAEEIGTMNGTFLNGRKLATGVLTPIEDGDEITLCRLVLNFKVPSPPGN